jgi:M6 family metalloprotease-like protein
MKYLKKHFGIAFLLLLLAGLFLPSCSTNEDSSSSSTTATTTDNTTTTVTCPSSRTLTASTKVPLLLVRVQYADATFQSSETTWADKMFGTSDGQMNHYLDETTYGKYQFTPAAETSGCTDDGVVTVTMSGNHPNTQTNTWACYASAAITATDSSVDFSAYDNDSNGKLSLTELQVIFLVAGGESASGINTPGGVWAMATGMLCDANGNGSYDDESGEHGITLDSVRFLGYGTIGGVDYGQNGYSQFGERQGSSSSSTWDATIGVMAHELGHAYFLLPDLYDTRVTPISSGIGSFGLMGGGTWGYKSSSEYAGATPVHFSAWTKEKLSICTPQTIASGTNSITLPAVYQSSIHAASCGIYKATTSTSGEYFLFENRSSGGYDQGLKGLLLDNSSIYAVGNSFSGGVAIWHVKDIYSSCYPSNNCGTQSPPLVDLEEANNADLDNGSSNGRTTHLYYSANSATFDNSSTPDSKLYDNSSSGISATSISAAGDSMTLTISK